MLKDKSKWKIEWIVFAFFAISLAIISFFHEPWYDEAEAWQIARCARLKDILFVLPHYEGHPALWHLMLLIPARLGFPYEFSLGFFSYIAISLSGWIIVFKSPFPLAVRCLLPFHYFLFYQYGVVSRPYGFMTLSFLLLGMFFKERMDKPGRFMIPLAFLCMLSGLGIVLAGGVAIIWLREVLKKYQGKLWGAEFWKDRCVKALLLLLVIAILLILQIFPDKRAYAYSVKGGKQLWSNLIYAIFLMIPDATLFAKISSDGNNLIHTIYMLTGAVIWLVFIFFSTRRNRLYLMVPYGFIAFFSSVVYFGSHHLGIIVAFLVFWLWIAFEDPERGILFKTIFINVKLEKKDVMTLRKFGVLVAMIPLCIPALWTLVASYYEIKEDYFFSRNTAKFIKEHGLEEAKFLAEWGEVIDPDWTEEEYFQNVNANGLYVGVDPVAFMPYFSHNFCMNLNGGRDEKAYSIHQIATAEENREAFRRLKEMGPPDVLLGEINLKEIYGDEAKNSDYIPVYRIKPRFVTIWKIFLNYTDSFKARYIYVRSDLLDQYGLEKLNE
ncbi:MAG: hypothetical protein IKO41_18240 [Lachnospiraceae bacterium]|nr:hypothetical protein [Lachnospiraceae bacterium]